MKFEVNDSVAILDDNLSGVITKIEGSEITVATANGFELAFQANELVKINDSQLMTRSLFSSKSLESVLSEKETKKRQNPPKVSSKERTQPAMEVDLHIHQLVQNFRGMQNHEMLNLQIETAKRRLEFAIKNRIQRIVFIHGVGEGVLKLELEYLFKRYEGIKFYDANYQKYGQGATEIYIFQSKTS
ncbi:MAG: DNA mismatch repair protein MutS [Formosa sp.]|jgi:dsDNA-specific endonuclease/ATPase MutS2|nr:DNA mismatch repair protein MutS [Formosa sp.]MDG1374221.1 DNA mismatch repair protein MutS [Flavobacteriaceae bacterium]